MDKEAKFRLSICSRSGHNFMAQSSFFVGVGNIPFQLPYIYRDRDIYIFKDDEVRINQVNNSTSYLFHSPSASRTGQRRERRCQTASRLDLVIQECERCADATCAIPNRFMGWGGEKRRWSAMEEERIGKRLAAGNGSPMEVPWTFEN
ncbi:predicted protein [Histoplasma capsulatum var. duboisii H88]|uniref:Predicted protein n=1 Tax=Ajellomyces capsulatus (strain H88) TaxID=544711 RepID=F0UTK9_AJEC8|nr:predicted protein [Histoplasma capsulatum var. duboisii H88]